MYNCIRSILYVSFDQCLEDTNTHVLVVFCIHKKAKSELLAANKQQNPNLTMLLESNKNIVCLAIINQKTRIIYYQNQIITFEIL